MHRLFVAIRPPDAIIDLLVDAMDDSPTLRWVNDENLHLTLLFIGEVDRPVAEDIGRSLGRIRAERFILKVAKVGGFEQRGGGAVWAGVEPKAPVAALAAKVDRACQAAGCEPGRRAFHPHITIARYGRSAKGDAQSFLRRTAALTSPPFEVTAFTLFESRLSRHGAHYLARASYPLD